MLAISLISRLLATMAEDGERNQQLLFAVQSGNLAKVKSILEPVGNRRLHWSSEYDLLATALTNNHMEIAKVLLNSNFSCHQEHFHLAILHANVEVLQIIRMRVCKRMHRDRGDYFSGNDYRKEVRAIHVFAKRRPVDEECERVLSLILSIKGSSINIVHTSSGFISMHFAAECGNVEIIPLLLSVKSHINGKTHKGQTPLHLAAANCHAETVRVLLKNGAKSNIRDKENKTALCLAVENEDVPTIEAFLETARRINTDPLVVYCAVETNNASIVEKILGKGGNPNILVPETGAMALHLAVDMGYQEIVHLLLQHKANPNAVEEVNGMTPLIIAAEQDQIEIFQLLLRYGAQPDAKDKHNRTALHWATNNGSLTLVTTLLESVSEVTSLFTQEGEAGCTPLHIAVLKGYEDFVRLFLDAGISVNLTTKGGFMPLHLAAERGNLGMVKLLLEYDADPSAEGPTFIETPLFFAAQVGNTDIVEVLSEITPNRKAEWVEGYFSLFIAAYQGHEVIVKMLLKKKVNPNAFIRNALTPLTAAAQQGHKNIVNILLKHKAEVNPSVKEGEEDSRFLTPLIAACLSGHEEIVQILLRRGADINVKITSKPESMQYEVASLLMYGNSSYSELLSKNFQIGYMPIHFAAASGKTAIVEMLINRGADINASVEKKEDLQCIEENNARPICLAVEKQNEDTVEYLLESGASIGANKSSSLLLFAAILQKNPCIVDLLLKHNAPLNFTYSYSGMVFTPLHFAVMFSNVEVVEALLRKGVIVDVTSELDFPLHCAVQKEDEGIISKLIEYGACLDSVCSEGLTPLFHAVAARKTNAVKVLGKNGASFNLTTRNGDSLLHFALSNRLDENMIRLIVECGVDVNKMEKDLLPIERIINRKRYFDGEDIMSYDVDRMLRIFLRDGLDVNSRLNDSGETLLHYAAYTRNLERVKLLLQYGADFNLLNRQGHTPLYFALQNQIELSYALIQAITRTEAKGGYIHPENLELMKRKSLKDHYNRCKVEIEEMKLTKIARQVSYFTVLIADEDNLAIYAGNNKIIKVMESTDLKLLFPFYSEDLKIRFEQGVTRNKVLKVSSGVLKKVLDRELPTLIVNEIFKNLRCSDLKNLCRALYPIMFLGSDEIEK